MSAAVDGRLRTVLDTNVLVSGVAYPSGIPGKILAAVWDGSVQLVVSKYILDELTRVLPRFKHLDLTAADLRELVETLAFLADVVLPVKVREPMLRDETDRDILGTLLASEADYLITGDKDLLALVKKYPIVTPAEFWQRHG